jgi:hypothetical protein
MFFTHCSNQHVALKKKSYRKPLRPVPGPVPKFFSEQNEFLPPGPALERFSVLPEAEVIAVDGAKHLWVGESATKRVLNEIVRVVNPAKYPLPERF